MQWFEVLSNLELQKFDFSKLIPLSELKIKNNLAFPTILALHERKESEKIKELNILKDKIEAKERKNQNLTFNREKQRIDSTKSQIEQETYSYSLVYINPELENAEIVENKVNLIYSDEIQRVIEESVGERNIYPVVSFIAKPLIRHYIDERMLQEALNKIKIEGPREFYGMSAIKIDRKDEKDIKKEIVIAEEKKENIKNKIESQIVVVEEFSKNIEEKSENKIIEEANKLPPLTKVRIIAMLKKKDKKNLKEMLLRDLIFLKALKNKLKEATILDLIKILRKVEFR